MSPLWGRTTRGKYRKVFHCPQLPQTFKNSRVPLSSILNRHRSWHPKMRKVQLIVAVLRKEVPMVACPG